MPYNGRRAKRSIVNILFSSCSAMVRFAEPRLALRPFIEMSEANLDERFAAWRSGGFLAQMFNRRTALEPTAKLSYEALHPPLRQTAVTCWASCLSVMVLFPKSIMEQVDCFVRV